MTRARRSPDPKPCAHVNKHKHGTRPCYLKDECGCPPCVAANSAYASARTRAVAYGRHDAPYVDAGSARAHVLRLRDSGMTRLDIAQAAPLSKNVIGALFHRDPKTGAYCHQRVRTSTAEKVLAVKPADCTGMVSSVGVRRRLEALGTRAWSADKVAARAGISPSSLRNAFRAGKVSVQTRVSLLAVYDDLLAEEPPRATKGDRAACTATLRRARAAQWAPDAAWDNIDDPDETPQGVPMGVEARTRDDLVEDLEDLARSGCPWHVVEQRVGRRKDGLVTLLRKADRRDVALKLDRISVGLAA